MRLITLFILLILAGGCTTQKADEARVNKPNIIIFIADDAAWDDSGAYGNPYIHTPVIDSLAEQGMRFTNFYLTTSSCSPSRSSIITGLYPHNTGAHELHMPLPSERSVFPGKLQEEGYYTAAAGKWHLGPKRSEFDSIYDPLDESGTGHWIRTVKNRPKDKPFFMWLASKDPHRPYRDSIINEVHTIDKIKVPPYLPDNKETRLDMKHYYDEIARLDTDMGKVLAELDRQGVLANTVIIYLSDNGRPFPRAKTRLYNSGVKSPFIVMWPGKIQEGTVSHSLVSAVDIAPTVCEMAGAGGLEEFEGKSFLPILNDDSAVIRTYAYSEHNWHDYQASERSVTNGKFLLIHNYFFQLTASPPADAVSSTTYQEMFRLKEIDSLDAQYADSFIQPRDEFEFFDLKKDPYQMKNQIGNDTYSADIKKMKEVLRTWQQESQDSIAGNSSADRFDRRTGKAL